MGPAYCQLAVVIFPLAHGPQHPKRRLSWLKKSNLKRRTGERQNTQRETHATAQRQRAHVHSSHAAHAAGAPFAAHPAPNRAGWPCRALLYVPRGVNLDLTSPRVPTGGVPGCVRHPARARFVRVFGRSLSNPPFLISLSGDSKHHALAPDCSLRASTRRSTATGIIDNSNVRLFYIEVSAHRALIDAAGC